LPDNTHLQRHVNNTIAYNVWQYYKATGDREFFATYGAEMILEIARFLASITSYNGNSTDTKFSASWGPTSITTHTRMRKTPALTTTPTPM
jgi:alpha,alpha-trehalase